MITKNNTLESNYARSLIEASLDPLVTISTEGKITDVNQAMINIVDLSREKLIDTDFKNYFTDTKKADKVYQQVFEKGFVSNYPLTILDGKLTDVLFNGSVYKDNDGKVLGAVVVARDITVQNRIEKELNEARIFAELATTIAEEAKIKAELATLAAENAVKSKQQFLSNMSHEIRTPMNAIIGFTKVILKTDLTVKQREYLNAIKISGDALIVLINDILDLAKVDAGKMQFEAIPFKLYYSITSMLQLFDAKIQEKNLVLLQEYDTTIPEVLIGDPVRLHQIILNLMSNAIKFTNEGTIKVSVRLLEDAEQKIKIEFCVSDTGVGIDATKLDSIFENFQQASSNTSRIYGGTGLGLAIVKQLVESQGGNIVVHSEKGKGSEFSFTMEFLKTQEIITTPDFLPETPLDVKNIKVLVVEDMELNQLLLKTLLDDFGFENDIAANGKIAIEKLKNGIYDIVLMDLQMPEMNGFEATRHIREEMHNPIPIIALTADVTTVDKDKCKIVGMNDYLAKPIDEKLLFSKIVSLTKKNILQENRKDNLLLQKQLKYIDLAYLKDRTKSNPLLMSEMISLYLLQTPILIQSIKDSWQKKDWISLHKATHKIIPSFSIVGINIEFENLARKIQDYAVAQEQQENIQEMISRLEVICVLACSELEEELIYFKKLPTDG